ncbi:MAG TPA: L-threonylcarbamoyladenylate synthase [Bdellovibrionales bacterium]|nr:L-threonylcarbamoyladenylate synthase [Bdellovibrionales bacterium]
MSKPVNGHEEMIKLCRTALASGRVLAYPTETIWGLGADIKFRAAVESIYDIKGRDAAKAMSLLVADIGMARECAVFDASIERLMHAFWPGPVTFVLPARELVPEAVHGGTGFVGLRLSNHPFVFELMKAYPSPITTTSANRSGEKPAQSMDELDWLPPSVAKANWPGKTDSTKGSTVVKIAGGKIEVLREGAMPSRLIERAFQQT